MQQVIAALGCLLLAQAVRAGLFGWGWDLGNYRDAKSNYNELMTHCEREGGTCIDVDFFTGRRVNRAGATEVTGGGGSGGEAEEKEGTPKPGRQAKKASAPRNIKRRPKLASRTAIRRPAAASRRRRQANPFGIIDYLSRECWNWEFDFGCHGKGNICCY